MPRNPRIAQILGMRKTYNIFGTLPAGTPMLLHIYSSAVRAPGHWLILQLGRSGSIMKNLPDSIISSLLHSNPLDHLEVRQWLFQGVCKSDEVSVIIQRYNCVAIVGCCDV